MILKYKEKIINYNNIIYFDFETSCKNGPATTQPTQVSAVAINGRTLQFSKNDVFNTLIRPEMDDEVAISKGLSPVDDETLEYTHLTREELKKAPIPAVAFSKFKEFVERYSGTGSVWKCPVRAGFNIFGFDDIIINRLAAEEPYKFGPYDEKYKSCTIWHPRDAIDLQRLLFVLFENIQGINSLSMDSVRQLFGMPDTGKAHDARIDVLEGAFLLTRLMGWFRKMCSKSKFEGTMGEIKVMDYIE